MEREKQCLNYHQLSVFDKRTYPLLSTEFNRRQASFG
nr:MAG TPA: hypothetical protein [Caudoviricetes sp.]